MIINHSIFFTLLLGFVLSILIGSNLFDPLDKIYGHGISTDKSLPFDISGRQIAVEGLLEPAFLNESSQKPALMIRAFDEKTNETIDDINYRLIAKFKNETIIDQRFHSIDGVISSDLIPFNNSNTYEIVTKDKGVQNLSKDDLVEVSLWNPVIIKSRLLADGGLYEISVVLEKSSKGLKLDSDKKVDLFISIGKTFTYVITKWQSSSDTNNGISEGNLILKVKTFYDEITNFTYDKETSRISFEMPFRWNLDYVSQVLNLHEELIIPKSYVPLSTVSSFTGKVNGMEIPSNFILIDDFSDQNDRIVHIVIPNFKLKELTNQIIKDDEHSSATFELQAAKT
ncbi:MAG: hypothetical protein WCB31_08650 [Nitrososphaeraceae archaeon]